MDESRSVDPPKIACEYCGAEFFINVDGESPLFKWHLAVVHPPEETAQQRARNRKRAATP